jgi:hypothetical protein
MRARMRSWRGAVTGARVPAVALALATLVAAARPAAAQGLGDPVPFAPTIANAFVIVGTQCNAAAARALGGLTLFGSHSPSGSYVGVLPKPAGLDGEGQPECPLFLIPGVPPGTYWITVVYGLVASENVPLSAWQQITVGGTTCTRAPSPPVLLHDPVIAGDDVSVAFASPPDCGANEMVLEVGTQPGAISLPPITVGSLAFAVNDVPAGNYYLRARSRNPYGTSKPSTVVPISVPGGCGGAKPQAPLNPTVTVNGNVVTLAWSQSPGLASPPTFYVVSIRAPSGIAVDNILLPALTSISAALAPGSYRLSLASGNACGTSQNNTDLTFTVP